MAIDQLSEQEIQFRKRARRRLIGAIALVLLMVTVLPMVLDERESKVPQPEIAISIPSQDDAGFASKVVPTSPPVAAVTTPSAETEVHSASAHKIPMESDKTSESAAKPVAAKKPEVPLAAPIKVEETTVAADAEGQKSTEEQKPVQEQKAVEQKPVENKLPVVSAAKPALPDPTTKSVQLTSPVKAQTTTTAQSAVKKGSFSVQLGVLLATANIKPLQAKVAAQGLRSYTENLNTPKGTMIRLRAGPFTSRAEAEQAYEKLKTAGLSGIIVANK